MPKTDDEGSKKTVCVACRIRHTRCDCEVDNAHESDYDFKKMAIDFDGQMQVKRRKVPPAVTRSQTGVLRTSGSKVGTSDVGLEVLREIGASLREMVDLQCLILRELSTPGAADSGSDRSYIDSSEEDADSDTELEDREVEELCNDLTQPLALFLPDSEESERGDSLGSIVGRKRKRNEEEEEDRMDIDATLK
jgi:hypothetical protein